MPIEVVAAPVLDHSNAGSVIAQAPTTFDSALLDGQDGKQQLPVFLHSPPDSNNTVKSDASDSELSDLDEDLLLSDAPQPPPSASEEKPEVDNAAPTLPQQEQQSELEGDAQPPQEDVDDIGEVLPDHWSGAVAVFKPTMHQFKDFQQFMNKVDKYGMKSGIIKIIPPKEWLEKQPPLDDLVKQVRIREPIKQDIMGSNGTYRQVNILHGRSYNIPTWRQLCEQSEHQPPARRGERRANATKPKSQRPKPAATKPADSSAPKKRGRGRPGRGRGRWGKKAEEERPMTPVSPKPEGTDEVVDSVEKDPGVESDGDEGPAPVGRMGGARPTKPKTQSTSARRKYVRREGSAAIDEKAFKDFDYRVDTSEYTPERCEELERAYWKTLTYASPLYGADMMGTLFDEKTDIWNLNNLPNILDVLGTKVPGVNTAYLYLGMWKATFAWHLEDVDLYSINYLHFGAPKQWYSISQADARRFEAAMTSIWPQDAKACNQFLRHKAFLISPQHLLQNFGIKVNKVVSYPGEFVVTYPYGYHSGYNLGYNCAEAVNFGLDSWLSMGKIAKKCECAQAQDSVWIDVHAIERRLRGEETEYEETDEDDDDEDDDDEDMSGIPSPPGSHGVKFKTPGRKRKRGPSDKGQKVKTKRIKLRLKPKVEPPCCLCPNDLPVELLSTNDGRKAHRMCALYLPETYIETVDDKEIVYNVNGIHKDRMDLKCLYCRSKRGACFQCSQKKCARAYHPTCAAAAGVFIEEGDVPVFGEDGTEYKEQAFEFSCRFHRTKRDKKHDGSSLEENSAVREAAQALRQGDICQLQYYRGDVFAGIVVENRSGEETVLVDVIPNGDRIDIEWKWLLVPDATDYHLPKASAKALPLPASQKARNQLNARRSEYEPPRKGDEFVDNCVWAEFNSHETELNKEQVNVDLSKDDQIWFYLGKTSTEAKAQYTEDPKKPRHNTKGNYLDTLPKPPPKPKPAPVPKRTTYAPPPIYQPYTYPVMNYMSAPNAALRPEKPYMYKPKVSFEASFDPSRIYTSERFAPTGLSVPSPSPYPYQQSQTQPQNPTTHPPQKNLQGSSPNGFQYNRNYSAQQFEVRPQYQGTTVQHASPYGSSQPTQKAWNSASPEILKTIPAHIPPVHAPLRVPAAVPEPVVARPATKPTWQIHSSIYQKYPFFHVNHNRDASKYRTPYSSVGGFTNGYEGNLRAHLLANTESLLRKSKLSSASTYNQQRTPPANSRPAANVKAPVGPPSQPITVPRMNTAPVTPQTSLASAHRLHPAIKAQYMPASTQHAATPQQHTPVTLAPIHVPAPASISPAVNAAQIANKPKQSPVPLPANFLAAMTTSPTTPAPSARPPTPQVNPAPAPSLSPSGTVVPARPAPASALNQAVASSPLPMASTASTPLPKAHGTYPQQNQAIHPPQPIMFPPSIKESKPTLPVVLAGHVEHVQEFPDIPSSGSMLFMDRMLADLRRVSGRPTVA